MKRMTRVLVHTLTVAGLVAAFFLAPQSEIKDDRASTFISADETPSHTFPVWSMWQGPLSGEEQPQEEDDDDDQTKDLPRFHASTDLGFLKLRHFFDHPGFDQKFSQVSTPPPRR